MLAAFFASAAPGALAAEAVEYVDREWDGTQAVETLRTVTDYTLLDGTESEDGITVTAETNWPSGWYVVKGKVTCTNWIHATGSVHLILCDGRR